MASEDDHLHLSCESSDSDEDKTLPENASKQYGLQHYQSEPYTAENRSTNDSSGQKETPVTANMAVAWIVLSGEHFCCCFLPFFLFSLTGKISWDILNAFLCHKYHPNHSNRVIYSERRKHFGKRARKLDPDLMSERSICTIKDKNMEQNLLFVQIVGFVRFV